jgi:hypothetical protein
MRHDPLSDGLGILRRLLETADGGIDALRAELPADHRQQLILAQSGVRRALTALAMLGQNLERETPPVRLPAFSVPISAAARRLQLVVLQGGRAHHPQEIPPCD